jgi:predicted outer membrane repeat protein
LTFKNSGSNALLVNGDLSNSTINATFINNTASGNGGAIRFWGDLDNVNISGKFIGNTVRYDGGAIYAGSIYNSNIYATFINNTASRTGAVLYISSNLNNVNISGNFTNNVGGNQIIYIGDTISNSVIHDSIFINNDANVIIHGNGIQSINNWFGNNATNFNINPNVGIELDNWLFLDATADPSEPNIGGSSTINFKLYKYDTSGVTDYNGPIDIQMDLTQTKGQLNKDTASLGEEITYTAKQAGNAEVTATFETASYTVELTNFAGIWYVNGSKNSSGNGKSEAKAFKTLKEAINAASNGQTIMIASGTYTGSNNVGLTINKNSLTFNKYGDGEAIFDAQKNSRIWVVKTSSDTIININGLTFKNGNAVKSDKNYAYGGAIKFDSKVINSNINATFIDNIADFGAGIYFKGNMENSVVTGMFINNTATGTKWSRAGAILFWGEVIDSTISGTYIGNKAEGDPDYAWGSVFYFALDITNVNIGGTYINNTGINDTKYVIHLDDDAINSVIQDAVFVNNYNNTNIYVDSGTINVKNCWFGNNATNYQSKPQTNYVKMNDWLFLNAIADSSEVEINESSTINFKLYKYSTSGGVTVYNGPIDIQLDLTQTLGELDKNTASLGEEITYTAKNRGIGGVTATFETASYTVELDTRTHTVINITNPSVDLKVNGEVASGATLTPADAGNLTYTSSNPSVAIVENGMIKGIKEGKSTITVSFAGNENYTAAENKIITVTVSLNDASVSVNNETVDLKVDDTFTIVATTTPEGLNVTYVPDDSGVYTIDENGVVTALTEGNGSITVKVGDVSVYAENSTIVTVSVSKVSTEIIIANATIDLEVLDEVASGATLTPADAGILTYISNDENVAGVENGNIMARAEGNAVITVSFAGDNRYAAAENKTIAVSVKLKDASVSVNNETVDLKVYDTFDLIASAVPEGLTVNFTSSDVNVVTVDAEGNVVAVAEGNAVITVSVGGDGVYALNSTDVAVSVSRVSTEITAEDVLVVYGDTADKLIVELKDAEGNPIADAKVKIVVGDLTKSMKTSSKGKAYINTKSLAPGDYVATVTYAGDDYYAPASTTANVAVRAGTVLTAEDVTVVYQDAGGRLIVVLKDAEGNPIADAKVKIVVGDLTKSMKTYDSGKAFIGTKSLAPGDYVATVTYAGDDYYAPASATANIAVRVATVLTAEDVTVVYQDDSGRWVAELKDIDGNPISGAKVKITVGDLTKSMKTSSKGNSYIGTKSLDVGDYVATVTFAGDDYYAPASATANVAVRAGTVLSAEDIVVIYGDTAGRLVVELKDADGNPISDAKIKFTLGDLKKSMKTSSNGKAYINTKSLDIGDYVATVTYAGDDYYNGANITIKVSVRVDVDLTAEDIIVVCGDTSGRLVAELKDAEGNPIADAKVKITVGDLTKSMKTSSNGKAYINTKSLDVGDYVATVTYAGDDYYAPASTTANVAVKKAAAVLTASDLVATYGDSSRLIAQLKDTDGNPISDAKVKFTIDGLTKSMNTYDSGKAFISTKTLTPGSYTAVISYAGDDDYTPSSITVNVLIKEANA